MEWHKKIRTLKTAVQSQQFYRVEIWIGRDSFAHERCRIARCDNDKRKVVVVFIVAGIDVPIVYMQREIKSIKLVS